MKKPDQAITDRQNKSTYFIFGFIALCLAWFINKDISLPSWLIIIGSIFVVFFLLFKGIRKPEIPYYVLVAYMPFNKMISGSFGGFMTALNLTNILIFLAFVCVVAYGASQKTKLPTNNGLNRIIFIFCLLGIFSVFRGGFYYGSKYVMEFIIPLKRWLTPVFLYFLTIWIVKDKDVLKKTVIIIMIVVTVAGLLTIKEGIDIGDSSDLDSSRVGGIAGQPNMMGAFFVYYMFLFLGFFLLNWRKIKSWGLLVPFLICLRGIQVTFSRGALLAFSVALVGTTFFKNKIVFIALSVAMIFALLNPQWLPGSMRYAIERTNVGGQVYESDSIEDNLDKSSATRVEIWKGAFQMIKENPVWGVGYGVFPYMIPMYVSGIGEMDAHNTYVIIAAEMGIPVLIIFLLIILLLLRNTFWLFTRVEDPFIKAVALGMLGGIVGMIVANMFGSRLESEEVSSYFWILAGLIIRAVIMKKRKEIV